MGAKKSIYYTMLLVLLGVLPASLTSCRGRDEGRGSAGQRGQSRTYATTFVGANAPLPTMMAISFRSSGDIPLAPDRAHVAGYVKALVKTMTAIPTPAGGTIEDVEIAQIAFPLPPAATDTVRTLQGLHANVVAAWLDPITFKPSAVYDDVLRFGANPDYIAYFGDGWAQEGSLSPMFRGADNAGWVWVNHEYISNAEPTATSAPQGQNLTLAQFMHQQGRLTNNIYANVWDEQSLTDFVNMSKRQVGGSWMRIVQDPSSGEWSVDLNAGSIRYDATSNTLLRLTGNALSAPDHDDAGNPLPEPDVIVGIQSDCSGGQTPWGTVISAEEHVHYYYGGLDIAFDSKQKFVRGAGFDPGQEIRFSFAASSTGDFGASPDPNAMHNRDFYGYLAEIDPGQPPGEYEGRTTAGIGHKKIGAMGRARWENATFVVDANFELIDGEPIVIYAGNDRQGGRIYKLVSADVFDKTTMDSKEKIRPLLDTATLYVAHFEDLDNSSGATVNNGRTPVANNPGRGRWIELSVTSTDIAPNAEALGDPERTVGNALRDNDWNGIGGFAATTHVLWALFTAATKIGVRELNRPEDLEWNPKDLSGRARLYVSFTNHTRRTALDQDGKLIDPDMHDATAARQDKVGRIFAIDEDPNTTPAASKTFTFFEVWSGRTGNGRFAAANPDNLLIDRDGGVWFGTDGNFALNKTADSIYYLDLDPAHKAGAPAVETATFGQAFRVASGPSDSEATGPAFSSGMGTLFFNAQHPGEYVYSNWPAR